jgi:hypothetical protein
MTVEQTKSLLRIINKGGTDKDLVYFTGGSINIENINDRNRFLTAYHRVTRFIVYKPIGGIKVKLAPGIRWPKDNFLLTEYLAIKPIL